MRAVKLALVLAAAAALTGCCTSVPTCAGPKSIMDVSPARIQGTCRPEVNKSWGCGDTYNCADSSTVRSYL